MHDNSRRTFVRNIGMLVAGLSVGPAVASANSNLFGLRRIRIAAFGYGHGWQSFIQQLKSVTQLNCVYLQKIQPGSNASQQLGEKLKEILKNSSLDGILLYHPQQGWESLANTILMHKLHLYVQGPVSKNLQLSKRLAISPTEGIVFHWHPMQGEGSAGNSSDSPQINFFKDVSLWERLLGQLPLEDITQVDGHIFTKTDSFHILYHFGSGPNKKIWQWIKGDLANNFLPGLERPGITRQEDQIIVAAVEPGFDKTVFTNTKQIQAVSASFSSMQEKSIRMETWVHKILYPFSFPCSNQLFSVAKVHQLSQLYFLKEMILNGFPHYKPLNSCCLHYPNDYLCLSWNAGLLRVNNYKDLNHWIVG